MTDWTDSPPPPNKRPPSVFRTMKPEDVVKAREAFWIKKTYKIIDLAKRFNLSYNAMRAIIHGRTYKDAGGPTGPQPEAQNG